MKALFLLLIMLPSLAWADTEPDRTKLNNRCNSYKMCDAFAGTGVCTHARNADEIVLTLDRYAYVTFYSTESGASAYTCDVYTSDAGYDAATATDQVNTTSITEAAPVLLIGGLLADIWISCSVNTGADITIDAKVCEME